MFSYRHAFHAGNHADVLKHVVLIQLLNIWGRKMRPTCISIPMPALACMRSTRGYAAKNAEFDTGIARCGNARNCRRAAGRLSQAGQKA